VTLRADSKQCSNNQRRRVRRRSGFYFSSGSQTAARTPPDSSPASCRATPGVRTVNGRRTDEHQSGRAVSQTRRSSISWRTDGRRDAGSRTKRRTLSRLQQQQQLARTNQLCDNDRMRVRRVTHAARYSKLQDASVLLMFLSIRSTGVGGRGCRDDNILLLIAGLHCLLSLGAPRHARSKRKNNVPMSGGKMNVWNAWFERQLFNPESSRYIYQFSVSNFDSVLILKQT